jgi:hypothetical protein
MHKLIAFAGLSLFFFLQISAQDNFEGIISYKVNFPGEKDAATMKAFFGKQKIKILVNQGSAKPTNKEDLILDFSNGIYYNINNISKSYSIDSIKKSDKDLLQSIHSLVPLPKQNKIQVGFKTSAFTLPLIEKTAMPFENAAATIWYADSLFYKIPEKYASVAMVVLFTNGNTVGFGMKLTMQTDQKKLDSFELTPIAVEQRSIPDSLLDLPIGYILSNAFESLKGQETIDSVKSVPADTIAVPSQRVKDINNAAVKGKQPKQNSNKKPAVDNPKTTIRKTDH